MTLRHGNHNAELVEIERTISEWYRKHPGQSLPLGLQRKLDDVTRRYAVYVQGKGK